MELIALEEEYVDKIAELAVVAGELEATRLVVEGTGELVVDAPGTTRTAS